MRLSDAVTLPLVWMKHSVTFLCWWLLHDWPLVFVVSSSPDHWCLLCPVPLTTAVCCVQFPWPLLFVVSSSPDHCCLLCPVPLTTSVCCVQFPWPLVFVVSSSPLRCPCPGCWLTTYWRPRSPPWWSECCGSLFQSSLHRDISCFSPGCIWIYRYLPLVRCAIQRACPTHFHNWFCIGPILSVCLCRGAFHCKVLKFAHNLGLEYCAVNTTGTEGVNWVEVRINWIEGSVKEVKQQWAAICKSVALSDDFFK